MLTLVIFCAFIAASSLVAGWAPLLFANAFQTAYVSQVASGIILGTAFIIVVPEGYEEAGEAGFGNLAGAAVVLGFLLMLVVDKSYGDPSGPEDYEMRGTGPEGARSSTQAELDWRQPRTWFRHIDVTTFGMTIHAAADGIALAAASAAQKNTKLKVLVFFSIVMHKMPASLSLTSVLLAQHAKHNYSISQIKRDILLFSLAGPVVALVLAMPLWLVVRSSEPKLFMGICLAFSGGTFVFAAAHILQQVQTEANEGWRSIAHIAGGTLLPFLASFAPE